MTNKKDDLTLDDLAMLKLALEHATAPLITNHPQYDKAVRRFKLAYADAQEEQEFEKSLRTDKRKGKTLKFKLVNIEEFYL